MPIAMNGRGLSAILARNASRVLSVTARCGSDSGIGMPASDKNRVARWN